MNASLWAATTDPSLKQSLGGQLQGTHVADIGIVGAGYTGLWTAYYLLQLDPSLSISIIDAKYAGFGASGRNGGWVSALFPASLEALARKSNRAEAVRMHQAMTANISQIGSVIRHQNWDVDWHHGGTVVAARTPVQLDRAMAEVRSMQSWGLGADLELLDEKSTRERINATDVLGGTFTPHCAAINPFKLVRLLAIYLKEQGVVFFESTPVGDITPGLIRTETGSLRAPITIRATEGYTRTLKGERRTLAPVYSLMLATEPLPPEVMASIGLADRETFADHRNLIIYGQRTADNRIAFGGRGAPYFYGSKISPAQDQNSAVHQELWHTLTDMFPILHNSRVTHTWGGPLGIARDWWASCGFDPVTGQAWSGGYVGDGVGTSHLGGKTLAHLITQTPSELTSLPWVNHHSRPWEPEPLRWVGTNAALVAMEKSDDYETRTGRTSLTATVVKKLIG